MRKVDFISVEAGLHSTAILTGPTKPVQHHGEGWQAVQRLMRPSYIEWQGSQGWELQIPIVFDGMHTGTSVERDVHQLELMLIPDKRFKPMRPPTLIVDSKGDIPHDHTNDPSKVWVCQNVDWQDYTTPRNATRRVRQFATVTLWEFAAEKIMAVVHTQNVQKIKFPATYKITKGDTLQRIAARFYGDPKRWKQIAAANHIRDPNHLKVGSVIKMPHVVVYGGVGP